MDQQYFLTQNFFTQSLFCTNHSRAPNFFKPEIFGEKKIPKSFCRLSISYCLKNYLDPEFLMDPRFLQTINISQTHNIFQGQNFLSDQHFYRTNLFLEPTFLWTHIFFHSNFFLTRIFLLFKVFCLPNYFSINIFCAQNHFWHFKPSSVKILAKLYHFDLSQVLVKVEVKVRNLWYYPINLKLHNFLVADWVAGSDEIIKLRL